MIFVFLLNFFNLSRSDNLFNIKWITVYIFVYLFKLSVCHIITVTEHDVIMQFRFCQIQNTYASFIVKEF